MGSRPIAAYWYLCATLAERPLFSFCQTIELRSSAAADSPSNQSCFGSDSLVGRILAKVAEMARSPEHEKPDPSMTRVLSPGITGKIPPCEHTTGPENTFQTPLKQQLTIRAKNSTFEPKATRTNHKHPQGVYLSETTATSTHAQLKHSRHTETRKPDSSMTRVLSPVITGKNPSCEHTLGPRGSVDARPTMPFDAV